ncbi:hypothetical protein COV20_00890 [Candidatus Woesearchaeota archaeon CG10_big_fil_rev_8_21_14_0_10_45_16]|nr:MAG: hypothetical protein COV20_00890 [Candidatus Woesearchaeota archaeon CG10_big_fil_rev_8_21_14_0_10_45_16]
MSLFNLLQHLYVGGTIAGSLNQPTTHYKQMSTPKKIALCGSLVLGIDSLIAPYFTGGSSLHESMGLSLGNSEQIVQAMEIAGAYAGTIYQNIKAIKYICRDEEK